MKNTFTIAEEDKRVSRQEFLNSEENDFRYEKSGQPNLFRLFHCKSDGSVRFSLYFGPYEKIDNNPFFLKISLSNVALPETQIIVNAYFNKKDVHHVNPDNSEKIDIEVTEKICQILNAHQVAKSYVPI